MFQSHPFSVKLLLVLMLLGFITFRMWTAESDVVPPARPTILQAPGSTVTAVLERGVVLDVPGNSIPALAFTADSRSIATVGWEAVQLWEATTGKRLWSVPLQPTPGRILLSIALAPDGRYLAAAFSDARVELWDLRTGTHRATLPGVTRRKDLPFTSEDWHAVAFSPDGQILAAAAEDEMVKLWDMNTFQERRSLQGHRQPVRSVAFSLDGTGLASVGSDGQHYELKLWDLPSGTERAALPVNAPVYGPVFSPDGRTLASGTWGAIQLWDAARGREQRSLVLKEPGTFIWPTPAILAFSPDGSLLAAIGSDSEAGPGEPNSIEKMRVFVQFWDAATGKEQVALRQPAVHYAAALSPDWKTLALHAEDLQQMTQPHAPTFRFRPGHIVPLWRMEIRPLENAPMGR